MGVEEIKVAKEVTTAFVAVLLLGTESVPGSPDILVPREPDGVSPVTVTVVVTMGAREWVVLGREIPVFWVMEDDGMILVWVGKILELGWVEVVAVMAEVPLLPADEE